MAATPPHIEAILAQVEAEITCIASAGETGTLVIHIGPNDIAVEVTRKRRREPVKIDRQIADPSRGATLA